MGFESPTTAHIITLAQRAEHRPRMGWGCGFDPHTCRARQLSQKECPASGGGTRVLIPHVRPAVLDPGIHPVRMCGGEAVRLRYYFAFRF